MSLVGAEELRAYLREEATGAGLQAALDAAEALVAAYLGAPSLALRTESEVRVIPRTKPVLEVLSGPMTALLSVAVGGEALDLSRVSWGPWAIVYRPGFPEGAEVRVDYMAGWDAASLPPQVRAAILITAAAIYARPDAGMVRLGTQDGYRAYAPSYLPPDARTLLAPYRRPRW